MMTSFLPESDDSHGIHSPGGRRRIYSLDGDTLVTR